MDCLDVSKKINLKIHELEDLKSSLEARMAVKCLKQAHYDKIMAKTTISLKNGLPFEFEGVLVENPPATVIDRISKGICWQEKLDMDTAEGQYKNTLEIIRITEAQLNGFQSINRYLSEL